MINKMIGSVSGKVNTTADNLTIDSDAVFQASSTNNIAIGLSALNSTEADSDFNVAIGVDALTDLTIGDQNTAIGYLVGENLTSGSSNTAIGAYALDATDDGVSNTAVGTSALSANCGDYNTAIGASSLVANTGVQNTAIGSDAMYTSVDVDYSVALGYQALYFANENDADGTVAIGYKAGFSYVPTGGAGVSGGTTLIGYNAGNDGNDDGHGLTTGKQNTAVGHQTLGANANAALTGDGNTVVGYRAGYGLNGAGHSNTFIGSEAGNTTTSGVENTIVGYNCEAYDGTADNQVVIGNNLNGTDKSNAVFIGNNSSHIENDFNTDATWNHSSDIRQKTDIKDELLGLSFINNLRPVTYKHKSPSEFPQEWDAYDANDTEPMGGDKTIHGFIAQEVKEALDKAGVDTFQGWSDGKDGRQRVSFEAMVMPLIKAVQELSQQINNLK